MYDVEPCAENESEFDSDCYFTESQILFESFTLVILKIDVDDRYIQ